MAFDNQGFGGNTQPTNDSAVTYEKRERRRHIRKRNYAYSRSSVDKSVIGLLIAILAVGLCLLCVSVIGMLGVSSGSGSTQPPVQEQVQQQTPVVNQTQQQTPVVTPENTTVSQNTDTPVDPNGGGTSSNPSAPQTDAEWLEFFNTSLNKLKTDGPAVTKEKQVVTSDIKLSNPLGNTVVSAVKSQLLSEELITTPIAKGDTAAAIANISPDGKNHVSTLTMSDIKSLTHTTDANGNYVITVNALDMTNPEVSGPYGKVFIFLTVDEVLNSYAPDIGATVSRENVELVFKNCSATATISPDGKVVAYETTLNINMILKSAKIAVITTDVDATLLSHTEYKNIVW